MIKKNNGYSLQTKLYSTKNILPLESVAVGMIKFLGNIIEKMIWLCIKIRNKLFTSL